MVEILFDRIQETIPEQFNNGGVRHGLSVIGRFACIAAIRAAQQLRTQPGIIDITNHPTTIASLHTPAKENNRIAAVMEREMGLGRSHSGIRYLRRALASYALNGDALSIARADEIKQYAVMDAARNGYYAEPLKRKKGCPAGRIGIIEPSYREIIKICNKDPELFAATLRTYSPRY